MESFEAKFHQNPSLKTHKLFLGAQICWRMMAIVTAFAATWMIVTSAETVVVFELEFDARYGYSSAFRFLAFANALVCGFTLIFLLFVFFIGRHCLTPTDYLLFLDDMFLMSLLLSGMAAGTVIGYLGRYGTNSHAGSLQICNPLNKHCHKVTNSI